MNRDAGVEKRLQEQNWNVVTRQVCAFARRRSRSLSIEDAEEIASEAIARVWDPNYKEWDPEKELLLRHLGSVVNGLIRNRNASAQRKCESLREPLELTTLSDEQTSNEEPKVEIVLRAEALLTNLEKRLAGDPLAEDVLLLLMDGIDRPKEQAKELNRPVTEIYNAKRRLLDHYEAVKSFEAGEAR